MKTTPSRYANASRVLAVRAFIPCKTDARILHMVEGPCLPCRARGKWREGPIQCTCHNCDGRGATSDAAKIIAEETDGVRVTETCSRCAGYAIDIRDLTFSIVDLIQPSARASRMTHMHERKAAFANSSTIPHSPIASSPRNPTLFSTVNNA